MPRRLKLGDQDFYTFEEAAEVLHPLYAASTLRRKAYSGELPHHGGQGRGRVCFSNSDLVQIMDEASNSARLTQGAPAPLPEPENIVELPDFFRQTSRSRALHKGKAA